jgi:hypothetical protein
MTAALLSIGIPPLRILTFFNDKTIDYLFDNQAFADLSPLSISTLS